MQEYLNPDLTDRSLPPDIVLRGELGDGEEEEHEEDEWEHNKGREDGDDGYSA